MAIFLALLMGLGVRDVQAAAPAISSFTPNYGTPGKAQVYINGSGFTSVTQVWFNTTRALDAAPTSDTLIIAPVPAGATSGRIRLVANGLSYYTEHFTVLGNGPFIASFSPTNGSVGASIQITGANFTFDTKVYFSSVSGPNLLASGGASSDSQMKAVVPKDAITGPIRVVDGTSSYTTTNLFYVPPVISSFSPAQGRTGTNLVIRGINLIGARVFLGNLLLPTTLVSATNVTLTLPGGINTGILSVSTPGGGYQAATPFYVPPTITGFSPISGIAGNTQVTITGSHLMTTGKPTVYFSDVPATVLFSYSLNQIVALVPQGAVNGPISVVTSDGAGTSSAHFHLPPVVDNISRAFGSVGTNILFGGINFLGATQVLFSPSVPGTGLVVSNNQQLRITVPVGAVSGPLTLNTPGGSFRTPWPFYIPPTITSFSPSSGRASNVVTITGTSFLGVTNVAFGSLPAASFSVKDSSTITAVVPDGIVNGSIKVISPGGTATSSMPFIADYLSLNIAKSGTNLVLSWSTNAAFYRLVTSTNLVATNWSDFSGTPKVINGFNYITNQFTNRASFFRLKK